MDCPALGSPLTQEWEQGQGTGNRARTVQPTCCQTASRSLPSVCQSLFRTPYHQGKEFSHFGQDTPVSSRHDPSDITAPTTGFLQLWRRLLSLLGSGPGLAFVPISDLPLLMRDLWPVGTEIVGSKGSSFPLCSEASSLLRESVD